MLKIKSIIKKIIIAEDTLLRATFIVFVTYLLSSFLGLVRNRILAGVYGDSVELGIYYMADKLPSFIYSTLVLTIISTAFIPIFTSIAKKNKAQANAYTSDIINFSLLIYILFASIVFIFPDSFSNLVSWGSLDANSLKLMSNLMRIILISQITLIVTGYFSAYMQAFNRFLIPSLVPVIYNFGVIIAVIFLHSSQGIYAPALGMLFSTILTVILQIPLITYLGFKYRVRFRLFSPDVIKSVRVSSVRILAILAQRLYILAVGGFISKTYLSPSYLVVYEFANQLQTMPVNAFGVSVSQALFPTMSSYAEDNKTKEVSGILNKFILRMTYFMLPVVMMFFILRIPLVRILFGGDRFSWLGTNLTAYTLAFFSISMWFQALSMVLTRLFYAYKDSKTPTIINVVSLSLSATLWFVFARLGLGVWGLALAYSIGSVINAVWLYVASVKIVGNFLAHSFTSYLKIIYATLFCGFVTYVVLKSLDKVVFDTTRTLPLIALTSIILLLGMFVYIISTSALGVNFFREFYEKMLKKLRSFILS